jgi:two-component system, NarL family, sensor histidine kinase DesK
VPEPDGLRSLRRLTRLTLLSWVPVAGATPVLMSVANGTHWLPLSVLVAGVVVLLPVHWRRLTRSMDAPGETLPPRQVAVTLAVSLGLFVYGFTYGDPGHALWVVLPSIAVAELQYGRRPAAAWRLTGWAAVAIGALTGLLAAVVPSAATDPLPAVLGAVFVLLVLPVSEVLALRQWHIAVELDQARRAAAELGATRERLRFAEDLHDILGHALEVVSLKSELATRLAPTDPERAHTEMVEVQRLARGALRDVRQLARGRRPTDLDTELTGARTLLASAGIDCVVDGKPAGGDHSELLGRVLREAVTNLLRHADTRRCWITVLPTALTVVNDGVDADKPPGDGTGLAGLRRRVSEAGGELTAGPGEQPGTFTVTAVLT